MPSLFAIISVNELNTCKQNCSHIWNKLTLLQNTNNSGSESDTSSVMELNEKLLEAHKKVNPLFRHHGRTGYKMVITASTSKLS